MLFFLCYVSCATEMKSYTQDRLSARRNDTPAARLAEVGRRWCHCLYAWEACVWQRERKAAEEDGARRARNGVGEQRMKSVGEQRVRGGGGGERGERGGGEGQEEDK